MEKYEFIKELGAGSFGVANLCRDKKRGELVAIKFIERGPTVNSLLSSMSSARFSVHFCFSYALYLYSQIDENVEREIVNHRLLQHPNVIYFKEVISSFLLGI